MQSLARRLEKGGVLSCAGISGAAQPFVAALLHFLFPQRPIVVVTEGLKTQESFQQDVTTWMALEAQARDPQSRLAPHASRLAPHVSPPEHPPPLPPQPSALSPQPLFYPAWEILPHEDRLPHVDVISERLETLVALAEEPKVSGPQPTVHSPEPKVVVTSVTALLQRTFPAEVLRQRTRTLARGERIDPLDLAQWLEAGGYEPEAQVTRKGELALRGGILDVYPLSSPWPVRLDFFGDVLESLRHFDPITQLSREEIGSIRIPPGGELGILKRIGNDQERKAPDASPQPSPANPQLCLATLLDYLPSDAILLLCEPEQLAERADEYHQQVPKHDPFIITWAEFQEQAAARRMTILAATQEEPDLIAQAEDLVVAERSGVSSPVTSALNAPITLTLDPSPVGRGRRNEALEGESGNTMLQSEKPTPHFQSLDAFRPLTERAPEAPVAEAQRCEFFAQLRRWSSQDYAVHLFCNNDGERQRFCEIWDEYESSQGSANLSIPAGLLTADIGLSTHLGSLARGFLCDEAKLVVVSDAEIFGRYKVQRPRRLKSPHAQATRSALDIDFTELEEGDYVVHLQHGIGRYLGLQVLPIGAGARPTEATGASVHSGQECLVIEYAGGDLGDAAPKLYVPVTEAHLISKYVGAGKARPSLNTLGSLRWAKTKEHAERAVRDVASDLLAIQAARESQPGHAFGPDTPWQREFESAFIYEETPDQARAIVEAKADLERPKPMDRLICGDVGFGKTEVGIRAAFKTVMDGKQVAVLVPTTVLAQQHFNTFSERMADYPIRVELLSRFRSRRAQQKVVKDLTDGSVDIVIGTHRLLQPDIAFKDLGLVVIDEEQRFGVMHKEKFKMLRKLVDVLTLSATPIPRTLYLALSGARDMSTIQTPPHDRLPVETIVTQYDERLIREVIQRELNRGGQVFFLHNRVLTIETVAKKLRALLPRARIVVGHGQMHSDDLEEVMTEFVNGKADVLLSTTIIESGLDIPNANTIIIDRADRFGLSDLYQLRGRVGRYKHQAYAYLLLPRHGGLLTDVRKRLSAIKQYSTLGSGFKIAMRDLEIRGAGNLLGSQQSGHITAVGFDLYCQLLKQSVAALKGEKVKPRVEVQVRLDFLALSPGAEMKSQATGDGDQESGAAAEGGHATRDPQQPTSLAHPRRWRDSAASHGPSAAYLPLNYISEPRQRIEAYRKLAQATDRAALRSLEKELRDRFGPVPPPVKLLLQVAELKVVASERGVTLIEVKDDRLMLTRNNDFIMAGSKFPRLTTLETAGRLAEIKKLLLAV